MKSIVFTLAFILSANAAQAACSIKTDDQHSWIVAGSGSEARLLTIRELFESMMQNGGDKELQEFLNSDDVNNRVPNESGGYVLKSNGEPINLSFGSIPKEGKGDPACKKEKKFQEMTGLECRDQQLKGGKFALTEGIDSDIEVSTDPSTKELLKRIGAKLLICQSQGKPAQAPDAKQPASQTAPAAQPAPAARPVYPNSRMI